MKNSRLRFGVAFILSTLCFIVAFSMPLLARGKDLTYMSDPNLGKGVVLGTIDDVNGFTLEVALYEVIGVVCIHHRSLEYSRNCWDVDTSPKKIQELIKKRK